MAEFDEALKSRLLAYQKAQGLAEDGVVGAKTWTRLADGGTATGEVEKGKEGGAGKASAVVDAPPISFTAESYPLFHKIVQTCTDEQGFKDFLRDEIDVDLDELIRNIDAVLES
ncbi:MAG: hypothetical protein GEV28_18680 [Actinophytocola sp.]|uniref:peptidoglycan-binding domain-containing protein n=1 Tax=Actinophytocola sp. TaxID=1872138 RepID=UPI00132897D6|nr:peptidoglycan-binding domain-containing protein [Actinophytocola sp.]MPZ82308.1 hypothetical protein [Actinophytocola sp.]